MSEIKSQLQNSFSIQLDNESTLNEFINIIQGVMLLITMFDIDKTDTKYSDSDVYFGIDSILGYFNEQIPGSLKIVEVSPQNYTIQYTPSEEQKENHR